MSDFGNRVSITAWAGRLRKFGDDRRHGCVGSAWEDRPTWGWATPLELDGLEVVAPHDPDRTGDYDTAVDIVRVPFDSPRHGVVVGATRRQAGAVSRISTDEGNAWHQHSSCPVVCVAVDVGDAPPVIFDVHPDDVEDRR